MAARALLQSAVKAVAAGVDRVRPTGRGVTVLIYHRVGRRSSLEVDLPADLFDAQMAELAASGRAVSLDRALELLAHDRPTDDPPPDPVVVTFDDGTADLVDVALPITARHGVPVTLYLATDFVETATPYPDGGVPLSWSGVGELAASGSWSIESHTDRHVLLDRADPTTVAAELDRSIERIGEHVGTAPRHFAYPKAIDGSPAARAAVRERFASAALAGTRANAYGATDPYRLARSPIQLGDGMRWFRAKADGGMGVEDGLRRLVNRGRYAGATT